MLYSCTSGIDGAKRSGWEIYQVTEQHDLGAPLRALHKERESSEMRRCITAITTIHQGAV